ncbi:MAG TPA: hypothetical protein VH417_13390 [Vicinamibacterales bacterium]|jgi:hypothetical protein
MLQPEYRQRPYLLMTPVEWFVIVGATILGTALFALCWPDAGLWVVLGVGLTLVVVGHMCMTAGRHVAFPDLVALASCLQWIVAPWLADLYPPRLPIFRMALPLDEYLQYAVPATAALYAGMYLPVQVMLRRGWTDNERRPLSRPIQIVLDLLIAGGLIIDAYSNGAPVQWAFLVYLVASFRFFGALGWMVTRTPGWRLRVTLVMFELLAMQSTGGLFYLVIHWSGYFLLVYAFMRGWRWQLAPVLLVGVLGLGLLQDVKPTFRQSLAQEEVSGPIQSVEKLASLMWARLQGEEITTTQAEFGDRLVRFNQGWIIARVMAHVPKEEPYARGETLADAVVFSIVPRFLVPNKKEGASSEMFERFTGADLINNTKMGLGLIGELYANFGSWGGIAAAFCYGLLIGYLFTLFASRAAVNPLWWAAAATILLPSVEPGFNIEDILNHVVKATVVFVVVWKAVPAMRRLLETDGDPWGVREVESW